MKKIKKSKIDLILFLLFCFITISFTIGYSALNQELSISGEAVYRVEANIRITGLGLGEIQNGAIENYNGKYSKDTLNVGVKLPELTSVIKYKVSVTNTGNVSMLIKEVFYNSNNENIVYEGVPIKELIKPGEVKEFYITIKYKEGIVLMENKNSDISMKLIFDKPTSILALGENSDSASRFFNNGSISKESVETIIFSPTMEVGENAIGSWDASQSKDGFVIAWYEDKDNNGKYELTIGGNGSVIFPSNSAYLFYNFNNLKSINFDYVDTSNSTDMSSMFSGCLLLKSLNLEKFNTSNVEYMLAMFNDCSMLSDLKVSSFDVSKVVFMSSMFKNCSSLTSLDLNNFKADSVLSTLEMFAGCTSLNNINLNNFGASKVTTTDSMFYNCSSLLYLDLTNFYSDSVESTFSMFEGCSSLTALYMDNFKTDNVVLMGSMFKNCSSLSSLSIKNFNFNKVYLSANMFDGLKNNVLICVKDNDAKNFILSVRSDFNNILVSA